MKKTRTHLCVAKVDVPKLQGLFSTTRKLTHSIKRLGVRVDQIVHDNEYFTRLRSECARTHMYMSACEQQVD